MRGLLVSALDPVDQPLQPLPHVQHMRLLLPAAWQSDDGDEHELSTVGSAHRPPLPRLAVTVHSHLLLALATDGSLSLAALPSADGRPTTRPSLRLTAPGMPAAGWAALAADGPPSSMHVFALDSKARRLAHLRLANAAAVSASPASLELHSIYPLAPLRLSPSSAVCALAVWHPASPQGRDTGWCKD